MGESKYSSIKIQVESKDYPIVQMILESVVWWRVEDIKWSQEFAGELETFSFAGRI